MPIAANGAVLAHPVLPSEAGAASAAMAMLQLAQRAATAATYAARTRVIRGNRWSDFNRPLIWAAAGDYASHAVGNWMARAATGAQVGLRGLGPDTVEGPVAVHDAWLALRAGMRAMSIEDKESLISWHSREGYGETTANAYLHAHVQVRILLEAFAALGGDGTDRP